ncbi:MAG: sulfotransferase, partial [Cyanobacteriota bacterium]|nr:sulfotransferase [Cyanobacteriota bacterium]
DRLPEEITCWGFKEIRYGVDADDRTIDMLLELFPESRNVVVTRHPWDTVVSMITAWNEDLVDRLLKQPSDRGVMQLTNLAENYLQKWSEQNQILLDYVGRFPDRFIWMRYEDFSARFSDTVFDFMGVPCPDNVKAVLEKKVWKTQDSPRSKCVKQHLDCVRLWGLVEKTAKTLGYEKL